MSVNGELARQSVAQSLAAFLVADTHGGISQAIVRDLEWLGLIAEEPQP